MLLVLACVTSRGGWDVGGLEIDPVAAGLPFPNRPSAARMGACVEDTEFA